MVGGNLCLPWSITRVAWVVVVGVRGVLVLKVLVGVPHRAGPVPVGRVGHALIEGVPGGLKHDCVKLLHQILFSPLLGRGCLLQAACWEWIHLQRAPCRGRWGRPPRRCPAASAGRTRGCWSRCCPTQAWTAPPSGRWGRGSRQRWVGPHLEWHSKSLWRWCSAFHILHQHCVFDGDTATYPWILPPGLTRSFFSHFLVSSPGKHLQQKSILLVGKSQANIFFFHQRINGIWVWQIYFTQTAVDLETMIHKLNELVYIYGP